MDPVLLMLAGALGVTVRGAPTPQGFPQWIVVTAPAFREVLRPLIQQREVEDGLKVTVVSTAQVLSAGQMRQGKGTPLRDYLQRLYHEATGPVYVLLAGAPTVADATLAEQTVVPPLRGTVGRMNGQPSDYGYGRRRTSTDPGVAVGRFPARNPKEMRHMVQKTLHLEHDHRPGAWRTRLVALIGNPGGANEIERSLAESMIQSTALSRFGRLYPSWTVRCILHSSISPFDLPDQSLHDAALRYLEEGEFFALYLGHSSPAGFWSQGARFLDRPDWARLNIPRGTGILFSCGCFGCQYGSEEGYGLAAMRNPAGPVAVIGALGESYAAMGLLSLEGLMGLVGGPPAPFRLADCWQGVLWGLAEGPIDPVTFYFCDQADGSKGKVPLDVQRREHLEMWTLLGDPALPLPEGPAPFALRVSGVVSPGRRITVSLDIPAAPTADANIRVTLERPLYSLPTELGRLPMESGAARDQIMTANHAKANDFVLASGQAQGTGGHYECPLELPAKLPWTNVVIRASALNADSNTLGVLVVPVKRP